MARIKGQEVEIILLVDGAPRSNLSFARSIEFAYKTELLQEGYLGETTDRYDTIFKGCRGNIEFHFDNPEPFNMVRFVVNKARRREPGTRVNVKATLNFPRGRKARVVFRDVEFGELPFSFGSRADFGTFRLDFACSEGQILPL